MPVQLMFVDGPTGSGKDYFIDRVVTLLKESNPNLSIAVWKATDFVLKGKSLSEQRKYVIHDIDKERLDIIYKGHHEIIDTAIKTLTNEDYKPDLIIVNRSILTMLGTNLWQDKDEETRVILAEQFSTLSRSKLNKAGIESLFVRVDVDVPGVTRAVNILLSRIGNRNDGKPVDVEWLYTIVRTYRMNHDLASGAFTYNDVFSSGDADVAVTRYFRSLLK